MYEPEYIFESGITICPCCHTAFPVNRMGRPRRFCSKECRVKYHEMNPNTGNWKRTRIATCPECGKQFTATREYNRQRKYCSRACSNKGRAKERKAHNGEQAGNDIPHVETLAALDGAEQNGQ